MINLSNQRVTILGVQTACSCVSSEELPIEVPVYGQRNLRIFVKPLQSQRGRSLSEEIIFLTNLKDYRIRVKVEGQVASLTGGN